MAQVRMMVEADIPAVSEVRVHGWQNAYAGIVPAGYLNAMSVEEDARRRRSRFAPSDRHRLDLVATVDGAVVGWACLGPSRAAPPPATGTGELYALYLRPPVIGTGVGRALLHAVHTHAVHRGFEQMVLWVFQDNHRARRFYERAGYLADGGVHHEGYAGVTLADLRYHRFLGDLVPAEAVREPTTTHGDDRPSTH